MLGLIQKDLRLFSQRIRFFILVFIIAALIAYSQTGSFIVGYLTLLCAIFTVSTIVYDEYDNCYPFLMTLPITNKTYVFEKYLFGLIMTISSWIVAVSLMLASYCIHGEKICADMIIESVPYFLLGIIMVSIMIPTDLKFGSEKGRTVMVVGGGIIFLVGFACKKLTEIGNIDLSGVATAFSRLTDEMVLLLAVVLAIVFVAVSMLISIRVMEKKEY